MTQGKSVPPDSNWGEFGPRDQRGRMNYVDQAKVLQGIAEVRSGQTFCLSLPLNLPGGSVLNPRRQPPELHAVVSRDADGIHQIYCTGLPGMGEETSDRVCDDVVTLSLQYSTQWDSFAHMGSRFDIEGTGTLETVFYNGFRGGRDIVPGTEVIDGNGRQTFIHPSANALGIENLAEHGAQGRGVMIDLNRHYGNERVAVGYDALMQVLEADGVEIEKGDMVCLYTGFADLLLEMNGSPDIAILNAACAGLDGHDERLLKWISDSGLACLISDNYAVEIPSPLAKLSPFKPRMPLHEHCLFKNGIHLGELWHLGDLARWLRQHDRSRFLLTAPPLRLPGAVGSPVTPIATV